MKIEVLRAWPRRFERIALELPTGATVTDALAAAGFAADAASTAAAIAVFGSLVKPDALLADGDRVELLRPLQADPKDNRRRRAREQRR